jgi:hypothetical protein
LGGPWFTGGNRWNFEILEEPGFRDTRARFHENYQQTFFHPGRRAFQPDDVFADARTEQAVIGWEVDPGPVSSANQISDHAPIIVTLRD